MTVYVSTALRKLVAERAQGLCEYCLIHDGDTFFGCQIEHIISQKHDGMTTAENLAFACTFCNQHKGSDIASLTTTTKQLMRLFNPRVDRWSDHFALADDRLRFIARSDVGQVTINLLQLNHSDRFSERRALIAVDRFPSQAAKARINR